jgi:hypothetical protein
MASQTRAENRKSIKDVTISPDDRVRLYAASRFLEKDFRKKCGLLLPFSAYFQDPFVAETDSTKGIDDEVMVAWEPGLADGPTSSRFAVVDYNADSGALAAPAVWSEDQQAYVGAGDLVLDENAAKTFQFHQVSVWALLQDSLSFFENASALGRSIPWAFEGNRLIVVPHAGYGENAFYDRESKSLQFYYFGPEDKPVYTCLSTDIVHHEFAHAVLDGIRPLYNEGGNPQVGAFHEFTGDLAAILLTLRNDRLRRQLAEASQGKIENATSLSSLAEEFGNAVSGRPYLRTARNEETMATLAGETEPHRLSEVMTGAMFDVLVAIAANYQRVGGASPVKAFWFAADRMQRMAIQPYDLLPPVEVTFRDYALAACRSQQLADPLDPGDYYGMLITAFVKRGILSQDDEKQLREPHYLNERFSFSVPGDIDEVSRSRAAAYRFLDDNREDLLIPATRDFFVADLYDARKRGRQGLPASRQIVLEYVWREEVVLEGARFAQYSGRQTTMLCGGTLVFNEDGNVVSWMMKPGSLPYGGRRARGGKTAALWQTAVKEGENRRNTLLDSIAAQLAAGRIGTIVGSPKGLIEASVPPVTVDDDGEVVQFRLSPHLHLSKPKQLEGAGERPWQISF